MPDRYNSYSDYLYKNYGYKVYKLPVNLPCTCPNRDGTCGRNGCIFCGEKGAGYEDLPSDMSVSQQIERNMKFIKEKYKAEKFIAYFQNFSNTYMDIKNFANYIEEACIHDIVEISISTRPDCIREDYLEVLSAIKRDRKVNISLEIGLQTVNYHTLKIINRGHTLAEFIDAVLRIKKFGFEICTHLILDLPWDGKDDVIESAKVLSALGVEQVKLHSLYIVKNTKLGDMYESGEFVPIPMEEYIERVITFLEYLDPGIIIQRLIGRVPEEDSLFANWNTSWWKIRDTILEEMEKRDSFQGKRFGYLNGAAMKRFNR